MQVPEIQKTFVNEFDCAKSTGLSVSFLRQDRSHKQLLPFLKIGKAVRYDLEKVHATLRTMEGGKK